MRYALLLLVIGTLFLSCTSNMKDVKKGELIFLAEYDNLMGNENLYLYDNNVFEIYLPDLTANGKFELKGDTIFLNYFKYEGGLAPAFIIEDGNIFELAKENNNWKRSTRDTSMGIYKNKLQILL